MADYPTSLDSLTNPATTDKRNNPSLAEGQSTQNDILEALEAKVGVDSSAVATSHDYKLSGVTGTDKAVSKTGTETLTNKTFTSPVINTPTGDVVTLTGIQTLTNKTLTAPKVNEDVAVSSTATRLNYLTSDAAIKQYIGNLLMPVGFIYISIDSTDPNTVFGFGTWAVFGAGRTLVSLDSTDTDFDAVEETRGEKTHTLITSEMPAHYHSTHVEGGGATAGALEYRPVNGNQSPVYTTSVGGDGAHNNIQPSIVVYMFKRTA